MTSFLPPKPVPVENLGLRSDRIEWMGVSAERFQKQEVERAGLSWGDSSDVITTSPGALVTAEALRAFRRASDGVSGPVEGVVVGDMAGWSQEPCFGPPAKLYRGGVGYGGKRTDALVEFEVPGRTISFSSADRPGGRTLELQISDGVLISTHHWSGVLWANLLCLPAVLWRQLVGSSVQMLWKIPWAWLKTRSTDPLVLAGALNRVEKGVRIHPSAVVEGCWLRRGARVGPGAVVRGCVMGEGATVEAQALAAYSVIGPGAVVQRKGWIQYGVVHEKSAVGGAMQLGVLGPRASFKHGSYLMDQNTSQSVQALVGGEKLPAPLGLLGVGVGADTTIASGIWIAPGRTIAPNQTILPDSRKVLVKTDLTAEGLFEVRQGQLTQLS